MDIKDNVLHSRSCTSHKKETDVENVCARIESRGCLKRTDEGMFTGESFAMDTEETMEAMLKRHKREAEDQLNTEMEDYIKEMMRAEKEREAGTCEIYEQGRQCEDNTASTEELLSMAHDVIVDTAAEEVRQEVRTEADMLLNEACNRDTADARLKNVSDCIASCKLNSTTAVATPVHRKGIMKKKMFVALPTSSGHKTTEGIVTKWVRRTEKKGDRTEVERMPTTKDNMPIETVEKYKAAIEKGIIVQGSFTKNTPKEQVTDKNRDADNTEESIDIILKRQKQEAEDKINNEMEIYIEQMKKEEKERGIEVRNGSENDEVYIDENISITKENLQPTDTLIEMPTGEIIIETDILTLETVAKEPEVLEEGVSIATDTALSVDAAIFVDVDVEDDMVYQISEQDLLTGTSINADIQDDGLPKEEMSQAVERELKVSDADTFIDASVTTYIQRGEQPVEERLQDDGVPKEEMLQEVEQVLKASDSETFVEASTTTDIQSGERPAQQQVNIAVPDEGRSLTEQIYNTDLPSCQTKKISKDGICDTMYEPASNNDDHNNNHTSLFSCWRWIKVKCNSRKKKSHGSTMIDNVNDSQCIGEHINTSAIKCEHINLLISRGEGDDTIQFSSSSIRHLETLATGNNMYANHQDVMSNVRPMHLLEEQCSAVTPGDKPKDKRQRKLSIFNCFNFFKLKPKSAKRNNESKDSIRH